MSDNYFRRFIQWQNYAHYLLLAIGLFIWHALPSTAAIEAEYIATTLGFVKIMIFIKMFGWYLLGLFILDTVIHGIFWFLPEGKGRWRD